MKNLPLMPMKLTAICLLLFGLASCPAPDKPFAIDKLSEKNGYKDLYLEMPIDTFMTRIKANKQLDYTGVEKTRDGLEVCRITDSSYLELGSCPLERGFGFFFNGKLLCLQFGGLGNYD